MAEKDESPIPPVVLPPEAEVQIRASTKKEAEEEAKRQVSRLRIPDFMRAAYEKQIIEQLRAPLLVMGPKPTEEEREESRKKVAKRQAEMSALIETFKSLDDDYARLHVPEGTFVYPSCLGCDYGGYEGEPPEWPCRTAVITLRKHNVTLPEWL